MTRQEEAQGGPARAGVDVEAGLVLERALVPRLGRVRRGGIPVARAADVRCADGVPAANLVAPGRLEARRRTDQRSRGAIEEAMSASRSRRGFEPPVAEAAQQERAECDQRGGVCKTASPPDRMPGAAMQKVASSIDRYQVVRRIGAGGMGVVYEADDLERNQKVALKTISNLDVEKIYQLKRECRALADLSHPNLVSLYDLVVAADSCFFTMELLDGVDLLTHLWGRKVEDPAELVATTLTPLTIAIGTMPLPVTGDDVITQTSPRPTPCDLDRLRQALPQLARGL